MKGTALWLAVIGMGVATYALRISFIALLARMELPRVFNEALGLVPAAVRDPRAGIAGRLSHLAPIIRRPTRHRKGRAARAR